MGEAGLQDRRGHRKKDQAPRTELEEAQIEIKRLKHKVTLHFRQIQFMLEPLDLNLRFFQFSSRGLVFLSVEAYLSGEGSIGEVCAKRGIRSDAQFGDWCISPSQ